MLAAATTALREVKTHARRYPPLSDAGHLPGRLLDLQRRRDDGHLAGLGFRQREVQHGRRPIWCHVFFMIQFVALPGAVFLGWFADEDRAEERAASSVWPSGSLVLFSGFLHPKRCAVLGHGGRHGAGPGRHTIGQPHDHGADDSRVADRRVLWLLQSLGQGLSMLGPIMFTEILEDAPAAPIGRSSACSCSSSSAGRSSRR